MGEQVMGEFMSAEHPTTGTATLTVDGDTRYIEFSDDFQTDPGPDLFVVLHVSPDVIGTTSAPSHSFAEGDYVLLEPLQAVSGAQRYAIPAEVDLSQYGSVAIWCRQFNATFGAASLR
ncbi:MAG: DM13 domain-containing protein [Synechococcales cyanobacterium T60_A2020_003]|nr:DM13 domain-containing protein [Synechococcales cyanobacterium T60_A2020_003]